MTATLLPVADPYVGPRPFTSAEADRFFGRQSEISALRALLYANRIVVFHAPSGAGKTSLVTAGLFPSLDDDFEVLPIARVGGLAGHGHSTNPFVANVLASWTIQGLEGSPSLAAALQTMPRKVGSDPLPPLRLAVLDQFEELFTWFPEQWQQRRRFLVQLRQALETDRQLRVLIVIRDDYLGQLDPLLGEFGTLGRANLRLDLLRREAAWAAVVEPVRRTDVEFGDGVAERLVEELLQIKVRRGSEIESATGEFVEPVQLQVVCEALWINLPPGVKSITTEHWREFGDVDQALTDFYESRVEQAAVDTGIGSDHLHEWVAHNLITESGTRSTVFRGELDTAGMVNHVVARLEDLHVLRGEERRGGRWYELTHDRLVAAVTASTERRAQLVIEKRRQRTRRALLVALMAGVPLLLAGWLLAGLGSFNRVQTPEELILENEALATRNSVVEQEIQVVEQDLQAAEEELGDTMSDLEAAQTVVTDISLQELEEFGKSVTALASDISFLASPAAAETLTESRLAEEWEDARAEAERLGGQAQVIRERLSSDIASIDEQEIVAFAQRSAIVGTMAELLAEFSPLRGTSVQVERFAAELAAESHSLTGSSPNGVPTTVPASEFVIHEADDVIRFGSESPEFVDGDGRGTFLVGEMDVAVGDERFVTFIEVPADGRGLVNFTFDVPERPFEVWALVNTGGQATSNSMFVLFDRRYQVQNVNPDEGLNVRNAPGVDGTTVIEQFEWNGAAHVCTDQLGIPVVSNVDGDDWYQVALPSTGAPCLGGSEAVGWVSAAFIAWETWDMFEGEPEPPSGWVWDRVSTRCQPGDAFEIHSCVLGDPNEPRPLEPGPHLMSLRGREAGTKVAALVIRPLP